VLIDGAMADGGGDFTVVSDLELEFVVLFDVDSVTMAWAIAIDEAITKNSPTKEFFIWSSFLVKIYFFFIVFCAPLLYNYYL
jgi:hypothetical protein